MVNIQILSTFQQILLIWTSDQVSTKVKVWIFDFHNLNQVTPQQNREFWNWKSGGISTVLFDQLKRNLVCIISTMILAYLASLVTVHRLANNFPVILSGVKLSLILGDFKIVLSVFALSLLQWRPCFALFISFCSYIN